VARRLRCLELAEKDRQGRLAALLNASPEDLWTVEYRGSIPSPWGPSDARSQRSAVTLEKSPIGRVACIPRTGEISYGGPGL